MTGPLVVLGILSAVGGWLNLPALIPLGPIHSLSWLEPVVRTATDRVTGTESATHSVGTEALLVGLAVVVAAAGIAYAFTRLKPERLVPKDQSPAEEGFERVLANKYFVDEGYDRVIVKPTYQISRNVLWKGVDAGLIDGLLVNGTTALMRAFGWFGSMMQTGAVGTYAWVLVAGVLVVLGAVTLR